MIGVRAGWGWREAVRGFWRRYISKIETLSSSLVAVADEDDGLSGQGPQRGVFFVVDVCLRHGDG